jgi:hypothetical protein
MYTLIATAPPGLARAHSRARRRGLKYPLLFLQTAGALADYAPAVRGLGRMLTNSATDAPDYRLDFRKVRLISPRSTPKIWDTWGIVTPYFSQARARLNCEAGISFDPQLTGVSTAKSSWFDADATVSKT